MCTFYILKSRNIVSSHGITGNVLFQGKFIFKNGRIYEGEFINDHMAEFPGSSTISLCALGGLPSKAEESGNSASLLGPDMALNIETLLNRISEAQRRQELRQVSVALIVKSFYHVSGFRNRGFFDSHCAKSGVLLSRKGLFFNEFPVALTECNVISLL